MFCSWKWSANGWKHRPCWTRWLVGGLDHEFYDFPQKLGFSSSQLTRSIIFQRGRSTTNQMGMAWFFVELLRAKLCSFKIDGGFWFHVALSNGGYPTPRMAIPMATMIIDPWNYLFCPLVNVQKTVENHHFLWVNQLFLWPCSIAILNYQRVYFPQQLRNLRTRQIHTV